MCFYTFDSCIECQTVIDLNKIARDFSNMRRDVFWATCPKCESFLLPKIGVRLGVELNTFNKLKFNTSSYEWLVLYSPFHLKFNLNNGILKEFKIKLQVEDFKMQFNAIFWDAIWYFKIKNLDFTFMLPYESKIDINPVKYYNSFVQIKNSVHQFLDAKIDNEFVVINKKNKKEEYKTQTSPPIITTPIIIKVNTFNELSIITNENLDIINQNLSPNIQSIQKELILFDEKHKDDELQESKHKMQKMHSVSCLIVYDKLKHSLKLDDRDKTPE